MKLLDVLTENAAPGMIVAKDIYTDDDQFIVPKDTKLTNRILSRLKFYSIPVISIYEEGEVKPDDTAASPSKDLADNANLKEQQADYREQVLATEEFKSFKKNFESSTDVIKDFMDSIVSRNLEIDSKLLLNEVNKILSNSRNGLHLFDMINCMREYDDLTYAHSVSVSLLCHAMGEWLHLDEAELEILTIAGLLHDIGKLQIPSEIIKKPGRLTKGEYELVKKHTILGYNILKDQKLDPRIKGAALMHHERCDGTGYPAGILSKDIIPFAKITAIADVYDAMTANRVYREGICPFEVIEDFEKNGYYKFDPSYLLPFLGNVVDSYLNNDVLLSNNKFGKIILINPHSLSRPLVKSEGMFLDLSKMRELHIEKIE